MTTITDSPATARKEKAAATLQRLQDERETIFNRQKTAQETIEQMNQDIVRAERSGEPDTLRELRDNRRVAEECVRDLQRAQPVLDREIQLAEGELHAATVVCYAEDWNKVQSEQVQLLRTIEEALHTIADALDQKERLAARQQTLVTHVCPGSNHNAALIRHDLIHVVTARLQGNRALSLRTVDWSSWVMTVQGDLVR